MSGAKSVQWALAGFRRPFTYDAARSHSSQIGLVVLLVRQPSTCATPTNQSSRYPWPNCIILRAKHILRTEEWIWLVLLIGESLFRSSERRVAWRRVRWTRIHSGKLLIDADQGILILYMQANDSCDTLNAQDNTEKEREWHVSFICIFSFVFRLKINWVQVLFEFTLVFLLKEVLRGVEIFKQA